MVRGAHFVEDESKVFHGSRQCPVVGEQTLLLYYQKFLRIGHWSE